jgi:hypothetical protein
MRTIWLAAFLVAFTAAVVAAPREDQDASFSVQFSDCVESIGVGLVPTANVRTYVPSSFILVGDGQPVTPLVVRTARCGGISVEGQEAKPGEIVQIGAVVVPPDGTGDINNYTIWYYTSNAKLAAHLRRAVVDVQHVQSIDYNYSANAGNAFSVRVSKPGSPPLSLSGTVMPSSVPAGSFTANWWQATCDGMVKMSTVVPIINIGGADLTLTTKPQSALADLIGAETLGFPIIQQFNTFAAAQMTVNESE